MNRTYFVSCDPFNILLRDVITELRQQERLIYENGGYNEAFARENIVSVNNETFWRGPHSLHDFTSTAKSVLRTYTLQACNYPAAQHDAKYRSRTNNVKQIEKNIRHNFEPVPVAEIMRFIAEFDRLFPPFVIREKLEKLLPDDKGNNAVLKGELTVIEWNEGCISIIHQIICTVSINITVRDEQEICIVAKPHVAYYKINVKKPEDTEGERCSDLLKLLKKHKTEQLSQGEEEEEEGPVDVGNGDNNTEDDNDDNDADGDNDEDLAHDLKTQCNVTQ